MFAMSNERASRRLPILVSIVVALMLAIAPLPDWATAFRPDWVALTLVYWSMNLPRTYSVGHAWLVGIVLDVAHGTLLGQHALALSCIVYLTVKFHLQFRLYPVSQMALTIIPLLALYEFLLFWINGVTGIHAPLVTYWGPLITSALIWPLLVMALRTVPYRSRMSNV
jgi:rod shape-determining protein MreD